MQDNMKSLALLQYTIFFFLTKIGGWLDKLVDVSLPTPECIAEECNKKFVHSGRPSLVYESALGLFPDSLIPEDRRDPNSKPRSQQAFPGCSPYTAPWAVLDTMRYQSPILEGGRCDGRHCTWVPVRQGSWQSITMPANLKLQSSVLTRSEQRNTRQRAQVTGTKGIQEGRYKLGLKIKWRSESMFKLWVGS